MDSADRTLLDVEHNTHTSSRTPLPKYHIIKEVMLGQIADGQWAIGALIPSEPELCREFGVSRITVRRAIAELVQNGKLRAVQGKGTFVASPKLQEHFVQRAFGFFEDMQRHGFMLTTEVLRQEVIPAPVEVALQLGIPPREPVHVIVRVRSVAGEKILVSTTYIPEYLCPGLEHDDISTGSLYQHLQHRYQLNIAHGKRNLEAVAAGQWEARLLDIALGSPLLRLDSTAYLANGRAFEYSQALQRGDRARIEVEFLPASEE